MRRGLLLAAALLSLGGPAGAGPRILGGGGGNASPPQITYSPPALTAPVSPGTTAGTATVTGLSGGAWSMSPTSSFNVNGSTGAVTASTTLNAGTYTPTLTYSAPVSGETVSVSLVASLVVNGGGGALGTLDFSDPNEVDLVGH